MKFSILIPVYNVEKYISKCLDSIITQTSDDYEIICVDDGSTDSSGMICEEYRLKYPDKIKVIHKENEGLISARRIGINYSAGEYICFIDSDDFIVSTYLEVLCKEIMLNKPDIIIFGHEKVDEQGNHLYKVLPPLSAGLYSDIRLNEIMDIVVHTSELNNLCFKCVKTEIVDKEADYTKLYYVSSGEDLLQSLPLIDKAKSISVINNCIYLYRTNLKSMTKAKLRVQAIDSWLAMYSVFCYYAKKWAYPENVYHKRFGLILSTIFMKLVANRFVTTTYQREEYLLIIERLLKKDFLQELRLYKTNSYYEPYKIFKLILSIRSKYFVMFSIVCFGFLYKLISITKNNKLSRGL